MLPDPLQLFCGATAVATFSGGVNQTFGRTADGRYVGSSLGTLDEPQFCELTNRINFNGASTYTIKTRQYKNVAAINGIPQKDDELIFSTQIVLPHRSFVLANVVDHALRHTSLMHNPVFMAPILMGQR